MITLYLTSGASHPLYYGLGIMDDAFLSKSVMRHKEARIMFPPSTNELLNLP